MEKLITKYTLRSYECNKFGKIRILTLFNLLQDMADKHAEILNIGHTFCKKNNLAWIGRAYNLQINRLPNICEDIILETWPCDISPLIATRDFCIKDTNENILVSASSQWAMIDIIKQKPIILSKNGVCYEPLKQRTLDKPFEKLKIEGTIDLHKKIQVRYDDIDINNHVNNCIYPMWAMEVLPEDFKEKNTLKSIEINFRKQTFINDDIELKAQIKNNIVLVSIGTQEKECALVKLTF